MKKVLWGILLVTLGVIIGFKQFNIIDVNFFFKGWWTLFIIIPSIIGLFDKKDRNESIVGLIIGILFLLAANKVISFDIIWKLALPVILVVIGLVCIFSSGSNKKVNNKIKEINREADNNNVFCAFSGQKIKVDKEYKGDKLNTIFGGIEIDLTNAKINEDIVINCKAIFGGIDIYVPRDVKIEVRSNSIFGGVENKTRQNVNDKSKTIYIDAVCIFGGVEIK